MLLPNELTPEQRLAIRECLRIAARLGRQLEEQRHAEKEGQTTELSTEEPPTTAAKPAEDLDVASGERRE